jgi:cytochrome d ubiquinol oxidase subunit II
VATFFEGSNFVIAKDNLVSVLPSMPQGLADVSPVISQWANASHGLDALLNPWVLVFGFAVVFLARVLGILYVMNNVADDDIHTRGRHCLLVNAVPFVLLFVAYLVHLMVKDGYAYNADGYILMEPYKYVHNFADMWYLALMLLAGVALVLYGIAKETASKAAHSNAIWPAGIGTVLVVLALLLCAGWNMTAYYPSTAHLQSSLTIVNSSSSEFTLRTMFYASLLVPFVLAYIVYCWRAIDKKKLDKEEIKTGHAY